MAKTYAQALTTPTQVGLVRDVSDSINNLDRDDTPVIREIGRGKKATQTNTEFERERLPVYDPDRDVEQGKKADPTLSDQPEILVNHQMLFEDTASVSTTSEAVKQYNIPQKLAREVRRQTTAMKIAQNKRVLGNYGSQDAAANAGVGKFGSMLAWMAEAGNNRVNAGAGFVAGGYNTGTKLVTPYTPGTARTLTEDIFLDTIKEIGRDRKDTNYDAFMNIDQKSLMSRTFTGIAQLTQEVSTPKADIGLHGTIGYIRTDQGVVALHYDHTAPSDAIVIIDKEYWELRDLEPWKTQTLGTTGLSMEKQCWNSTTLAAYEPNSSGAVLDLIAA